MQMLPFSPDQDAPHLFLQVHPSNSIERQIRPANSDPNMNTFSAVLGSSDSGSICAVTINTQLGQ